MRKPSIFAMTLVLAGCSTPYQESGFRGGFDEMQLAEGVYQVEFRGNAYTRSSTVRDFSVLRGAELCLAAGYQQFVIVGTQDLSRSETHISGGGQSHTTGTVDSFGNVHATTRSSGPTMTTHFKPGTGITVQCLNDTVGALDALSTVSAMKAKHGIQPPPPTQAAP